VQNRHCVVCGPCGGTATVRVIRYGSGQPGFHCVRDAARGRHLIRVDTEAKEDLSRLEACRPLSGCLVGVHKKEVGNRTGDLVLLVGKRKTPNHSCASRVDGQDGRAIVIAAACLLLPGCCSYPLSALPGKNGRGGGHVEIAGVSATDQVYPIGKARLADELVIAASKAQVYAKVGWPGLVGYGQLLGNVGHVNADGQGVKVWPLTLSRAADGL